MSHFCMWTVVTVVEGEGCCWGGVVEGEGVVAVVMGEGGIEVGSWDGGGGVVGLEMGWGWGVGTAPWLELLRGVMGEGVRSVSLSS